MKNSKKIILLILDGWGLGKNDASNPIFSARTPFLDFLFKRYSWTKLGASGKEVGLPANQVGNSEAGHMNLGAGRVVDQDVVKISPQINTGEFFKNPAFLAAINQVKKNRSALHLMGMISSGQSPHSDPDHLLALLTLARKCQVKNVYLHLFTDGRDSPPRSSLKSVMALERSLKKNEVIATIMGRFFAMDRKKAWERTIRAYNAMTFNHREHEAKSPQAGITRAYNANVTDEFIEPIVVFQKGKMTRRISDHDSVIFFNLRYDRARQLAKPFVQKSFEKMNPGAIKRKQVLQDLVFVAMTDFGPDLDKVVTAYPSADLKDSLPMMLKDKKQIYIAEREKYAHVTFFFNGGYADPVAGEKRVNVPSPQVDSYARTPAMSLAKVKAEILRNLPQYDFLCANFASPDMIGHTGDFPAGIKAAEAVDRYVKEVAQAALRRNAVLLITADHGNLECMFNPETGEVVTEHTTNPVPFIVVSKEGKKKLEKGGCLGNVAPTILKLFGIKKSSLMSKESLL